MVSYNTQRNILFLILVILNACNLGNLFHYILNGINLKKIINTLHNAGKAFKSHSRIYILLSKLCVISVAVIIKLTENIIPKFSISVALAARSAIGASAAVFFASVKINLTARTAGTLTVLPEIILFAEPYNMRRVNANLLSPNIKRFVIVFINGYPKLINRHVKNIRAKFPRPFCCLVLKIISEAEITEHFKISAVASSFSYSFNIGSSDALLAGGNSC